MNAMNIEKESAFIPQYPLILSKPLSVISYNILPVGVSTWKQALDYLGPRSAAATMKLLRGFHYGMKDKRAQVVCRNHLEKLDKALKLEMKKLDKEILLKRLNITYEFCFYLDRLKTNATSREWFRRDSRPYHHVDPLQLYHICLSLGNLHYCDQISWKQVESISRGFERDL